MWAVYLHESAGKTRGGESEYIDRRGLNAECSKPDWHESGRKRIQDGEPTKMDIAFVGQLTNSP